jgi:hypothetical protein
MCLEMFFRGITFDASSYSTVGFAIQNSLPVEVILVTENTNWNNRLPNLSKHKFDGDKYSF